MNKFCCCIVLLFSFYCCLKPLFSISIEMGFINMTKCQDVWLNKTTCSQSKTDECKEFNHTILDRIYPPNSTQICEKKEGDWVVVGNRTCTSVPYGNQRKNCAKGQLIEQVWLKCCPIYGLM